MQEQEEERKYPHELNVTQRQDQKGQIEEPDEKRPRAYMKKEELLDEELLAHNAPHHESYVKTSQEMTFAPARERIEPRVNT